MYEYVFNSRSETNKKRRISSRIYIMIGVKSEDVFFELKDDLKRDEFYYSIYKREYVN